MQLLFNHLSSFSYMVTEQTSIGPDLSESEKSGATDEALLVKVCTEPEDTDLTVERAFEELEDVAGQLGGVERVVIFPWAHLADELADPGMARDLLDAFGQQVAGAGYETVQVPFGWYKEWELESKGHPMSVLSRSV